MKDYILDLNLIDLISEKHKALREKVNAISNERLNQTETHILAKLELHGRLSISEISRLINISRQGAQKYINDLLAEGYVETALVEGNSRDKHVVLTPQGNAACSRMLEIKQGIEQEIAGVIGEEQVKLLKKLLAEDWL
ncbi:MarR family transcriptional regulator [Paenibacillus sp. PK3_47]|uniref:MarR family winged helix-turn-helix transcriptional regulator n=1 Tax=Paenibacillus sp. PK3_47 TaxID=2072642 RepID=UPI00201D4598|nr:winged helix-turn-helix transcriptional regulator [Paenibacillus sp. PK3_47]UQZ33356.1 MarR family transcriptional regulator [Paenibacillus sp. PK3_47]